MSRPTIAYGSAHLAAIPPVRACAAITVAVLCAALSGGLAFDVRADRNAIYQPATFRFSQNVSLRAPVATRDGEPSLRVDVRGNCYVGAIRGVPAGVDLWRFDLNPASPTFDPGMQSPTYLGQPDAFLTPNPTDSTIGGADGGGDIDISVGFPTNPDSIPVVTIASLAAANISTAYSFDRGVTFQKAPATVVGTADDRMWNESTGPSTVWMVYRQPIPATALWAARSTDHGATFTLQNVVSPSGTTPGYIDVDHATGRVYIAHQNSTQLRVSRSDDGIMWQSSVVDNGTHGDLFDVVKVGDDGTVYVVWSTLQGIYLTHSTNGGVSWAPKVRVSDNTVYKTHLMPWLEAGSSGRVCVIWYATTQTSDNDNADWDVLLAQTLDATSTTPTFTQRVISDHKIHAGAVSLLGLSTTGANRNLLDYFQLAIDPQGAAVVAFTDDHNDFDGHTWVTRQLDGPSLYATANGDGTVLAADPPPLPAQDFSLPEVTDFLHDATSALLQPIPEDNPFDILSIDYSCESTSGADPMIVVTMKLSSLATIPNGVQWRANFTANAPGTSAGVPGLSDRGQQFFVRAGVDTQSVQTFQWGTAARATDGTITYTDRGFCDFGAFDQTNGTITLKVRLSQLNAFANPDIVPGSVLCGLRGQSLEPGFEPAGNRHPLRDHTRGGGTFTMPSCGLLAVNDEPRTGHTEFVGPPVPNPALRSTSVEFRIARAGFAELAVFDLSGRRVRTIQAGPLAPGLYTRSWDGRTDRFADAPAGMYFCVLNTPEGVVSERVALTR